MGITQDIWLAVAAGIFFGLYQLCNRKAGQSMNVVHGMSVLLTSCVIVATVIVIATQGPLGDLMVSWRAVLFFALAGLFHFVSGFAFLTMSQHRIGATRTGALVGTTPLFATVVGFIALREVLSVWTMGGIIMMVLGVIVVSLE